MKWTCVESEKGKKIYTAQGDKFHYRILQGVGKGKWLLVWGVRLNREYDLPFGSLANAKAHAEKVEDWGY